MKLKNKDSPDTEYGQYDKAGVAMLLISVFSIVLFIITLPPEPSQGAIVHPSIFILGVFSLLVTTMVISLLSMLMTEKASKLNIAMVLVSYALLMLIVFEFKTIWVFYIIS